MPHRPRPPIRRTLLAPLAVLALVCACPAQDAWSRNSFPGEGHVAHGFPPGAGSDRCEYVTAFGVSPHRYPEGWWIMMSTDLGPLLSSVDGSQRRYASFTQTDFPFYAPKAIAFNPHQALTAYVIKTSDQTEDGRSGIYRTQDKGASWQQIFREPPGETRVENSGRQTGQTEIAGDPHPDRRDHLYYAHGARGLFRTRIAHEADGERVIASWESLAFEGRRVKTISAGISGQTTIIYAIVQVDIKDFAPGEAWRVEIRGADGQDVTVTRILERFAADVSTICVDPADGRRGFFSACHEAGRVEGEKECGIYAFGDRGLDHRQLLQTTSFADYAWKHYVPEVIKVNPANPKHVVAGSASARHIPEDGFFYYSSDGGQSWQGQRPELVSADWSDANGTYENHYWPSYKQFGPTHWRARNPALPESQWWGLDLSSPWHYDYGGSPRGGGLGSEAGLSHFDFLTGDENDFMALGVTWVRELLKTDNDFGASLTPHGHGLQFKQPLDVAFGSSERIRAVTRAEHGLHLTRDGGRSWRGITHLEDPTLNQAVAANHKTGWRMKSCTSAAFDPDDDNALIINWGSPKKDQGQEIVLYSRDFGESWQIIHRIDDTLDVHHWGVGCTRVWWRQTATGEDRIYVEHFRCTDPGTWTFEPMAKRVVELHPRNPDVLIGTTSSRSGNGGMKDFVLELSTDAGRSWSALPVVPKEVSFFKRGRYELAARTVAGFNREYRPLALDPAVDPSAGQGLRLLLAGRSGIYEYLAAAGTDPAAGSWRLLASEDFLPLPDSGALSLADVGQPEPRSGIVISSAEAVGPRPELEQVVFDPQRPEVVYAVGGYRPTGGDRDPNHGLPGMPLTPPQHVYRSLDGGRRWTRLGDPDFPGLPLTIQPQVINVGPEGTFFLQDYAGEFSLPAPR